MTREEIIDGLEIYTVGRLNKARVHITVEELQKFIDEIKALSQEPTSEMVHVETLRQVMWERDIAIEQLKELGYSLGQKIEPCEDCISRQYLLDNCVVDKVTMPYVPVNKIKEAPPVKPQEKTGHWIYWHTNGFGRKIYKCSKCNWDGDTAGYNYCPNCGAKMKSEEG